MIADLGIALCWIAAAVNLHGIYRNRQILKRLRASEHQVVLAEVSTATGLTPLQAQVALDAATATFNQRVAEMTRPR